MDEIMQIHEVATHRHEFAREWKKKNGVKIFGYFGDYVPEEIIRAAGILPVKIFGSRTPTTVADASISPEKWCSFCRDCFAEGLSGRYDYLDGIVSSLSCFHLQQGFDSWLLHIATGFHHYLDTPFYVQNPSASECFRVELERFRAALEAYVGKAITSTALDEAIEVYNRNRSLMRRVYESMKTDAPMVTGSQAMEMVLASTFMDKEEHNRLLEELIAHAPAQPKQERLPRLMIIGAETDDTEIIRMIERSGAMVVADSHSSGTRYFWNDIVQNGDSLAAIADRYMNKIPLPQMDFPEHRSVRHVLKMAQDFNVDGAIMLLTPHCDPFQWDIPVLTKRFGEQKIPFMVLDIDPMPRSATMQNRIEAFIEMISERLFDEFDQI